jgi:hypothetical protein
MVKQSPVSISTVLFAMPSKVCRKGHTQPVVEINAYYLGYIAKACRFRGSGGWLVGWNIMLNRLNTLQRHAAEAAQEQSLVGWLE